MFLSSFESWKILIIRKSVLTMNLSSYINTRRHFKIMVDQTVVRQHKIFSAILKETKFSTVCEHSSWCDICRYIKVRGIQINTRIFICIIFLYLCHITKIQIIKIFILHKVWCKININRDYLKFIFILKFYLNPSPFANSIFLLLSSISILCSFQGMETATSVILPIILTWYS